MCKVTSMPTEAKARKAIPLATGCLDYFPDALIAVAQLSKIGNDQHNPGQPLHWSRDKSNDHADTAMRHFTQRGTFDTDRVRHLTKAAWRVLAALQLEIEADGGRTMADEDAKSTNATTIELAYSEGCVPADACWRKNPGNRPKHTPKGSQIEVKLYDGKQHAGDIDNQWAWDHYIHDGRRYITRWRYR